MGQRTHGHYRIPGMIRPVLISMLNKSVRVNQALPSQLVLVFNIGYNYCVTLVLYQLLYDSKRADV